MLVSFLCHIADVWKKKLVPSAYTSGHNQGLYCDKSYRTPSPHWNHPSPPPPPPPAPINTCQYGGIIALFTAEYYRSCLNFGGAILSCSCGILAKHFGIQQQNREHYITDHQIILFFHQKLSFPIFCIWSLIMQINAKHLGKMFTRWHFEIFLLFFSGYRIWYLMQIVINGDNLHEMSNQDLWKNKKNNISVIC